MGRVYELALPQRRLAGTISFGFSGLSEATHPLLARKSLGEIVSAELGQLVILHGLFLGANELTGYIPPPRHKVPDTHLNIPGLPYGGSW